jgi:uncharacterized membrane protein YraQ (UPF0718 family)
MGVQTVQGALVGLATPLCSCGALPVAAGFVGGQVPLNVVVAFLTATQSAGLDSAGAPPRRTQAPHAPY